MKRQMSVDDVTTMIYGMYPQAGLDCWQSFNQYAAVSHLWRGNQHHGECTGDKQVRCMRCTMIAYKKLAKALMERISKFSDGKVTVEFLSQMDGDERRQIVTTLLKKRLATIGH